MLIQLIANFPVTTKILKGSSKPRALSVPLHAQLGAAGVELALILGIFGALAIVPLFTIVLPKMGELDRTSRLSSALSSFSYVPLQYMGEDGTPEEMSLGGIVNQLKWHSFVLKGQTGITGTPYVHPYKGFCSMAIRKTTAGTVEKIDNGYDSCGGYCNDFGIPDHVKVDFLNGVSQNNVGGTNIAVYSFPIPDEDNGVPDNDRLYGLYLSHLDGLDYAAANDGSSTMCVPPAVCSPPAPHSPSYPPDCY